MTGQPPTPYYDEDGITIYHGDCLDVLPQIDSDPCDITVTSPKYNMGVTPGGNGRGMYGHTGQKASRFTTNGYDGDSDAMPPDEYEAWVKCVAEMTVRASRRAVFFNHRPRVIHGSLSVPFGFDFGWLPEPWTLRQIITWDRGTGIDVNVRHFCTRGEWVMLFATPDFRLVDHSASGMGDVWSLGMEHGSEHPAPFPLSLPARCIAATRATSVLDPFMGSGTTLRAAKDAGIPAIGIEKSEAYCELAVKRLAQGVLPL